MGWPDGFTPSHRQHLPTREEMMVRCGVPEACLPVLEIFKSGERFGDPVPDAPWIIGANGRLDLSAKWRHFPVIDRSQNLAAPKWMVAPSGEIYGITSEMSD